jgi:arsenate reductase (thioredoxin)
MPPVDEGVTSRNIAVPRDHTTGVSDEALAAEKGVPTVLFVCVHNAGRSQLAAGLAAHRGDGRVSVMSAGTEPDDQVSDVALGSLAELGIDRSDQRPTLLTDQMVQRADVIVLLKPGLGIVPRRGAELQTWTLPEPASWDVDGVRSLRDYLDERVQHLIETISRR